MKSARLERASSARPSRASFTPSLFLLLPEMAWGADARITSITVSHGVSSSSKASGSESSKTV